MYIVLSGGGTAGHINPALALAEELQERGHRVAYAGTPAGVEARLVPAAGIDFHTFEAAGFNRNHPLSIVKAMRLILASTKKAKAWFSTSKPDAVVCFGGYVCIPVGRAAQSLRIPLVVHEQNSVMGMANTYLAKHAQAVALTYEAAGAGLAPSSKLCLTGNPVRRSVFNASREEGRAYCNVPLDATMLVVFGGSLGARHINSALCNLKDELLSRSQLYIRHITGPKEYDAVAESLALDAQAAQRWQLVPYEDNMGAVLHACDMVVSRAGATSLAEISALNIPALLVPFPYATADHQSANARSYVEAGAAYMVADSNLETPEFHSKLFNLVDDAALRASFTHAAASFETRAAAEKLAEVVLKVAAND